MTKMIKAKEIVKKIISKYPEKIKDFREDKEKHGIKKTQTISYWVNVDKSIFKNVVQDICAWNYPFLSVISGRDSGDVIKLIYHFYINQGDKPIEEGIQITVDLPKKKPEIQTITDLIPGALLSELEKQEMLGINVIGIGDERVFLPSHHPKEQYPWRKDDKCVLDSCLVTNRAINNAPISDIPNNNFKKDISKNNVLDNNVSKGNISNNDLKNGISKNNVSEKDILRNSISKNNITKLDTKEKTSRGEKNA